MMRNNTNTDAAKDNSMAAIAAALTAVTAMTMVSMGAARAVAATMIGLVTS